jgi:hypothetical protein
VLGCCLTRVPVCYSVLKRDDERFGEGSFVPTSGSYGGFVAHEEFAGIGVSMIFWLGYGSVMGRPWCELQMVGERALGICGAELWRGWGRWLEELVA